MIEPTTPPMLPNITSEPAAIVWVMAGDPRDGRLTGDVCRSAAAGRRRLSPRDRPVDLLFILKRPTMRRDVADP